MQIASLTCLNQFSSLITIQHMVILPYMFRSGCFVKSLLWFYPIAVSVPNIYKLHHQTDNCWVSKMKIQSNYFKELRKKNIVKNVT